MKDCGLIRVWEEHSLPAPSQYEFGRARKMVGGGGGVLPPLIMECGDEGTRVEPQAIIGTPVDDVMGRRTPHPGTAGRDVLPILEL